ncbi:MAG: FecR domain-containing protein [Phycisphaerales bacterium]|nr:FecR domain-containing protein [Hyphomonadaceae bacterium]
MMLFSALCAGATLLGSPAAAQSADGNIGAAVAVRNQVTGVRAGQERALAVGNRVFQNESISTGANSVAQLMFTDQTTLSVGPRSQVTLDRYVYDPSRGTGDVAVSFATGAMRFVSGTQRPQNYQVRTPVATIGVRGTIIDLLVVNGRMFGILDEGALTFTLANGQTIQLNEPGTAVEFFSNGTASRPFTWRGSYESSLGAATYPLFGNPFHEFPGFEGADDSDDQTNQTDDLNSSYGFGG